MLKENSDGLSSGDSPEQCATEACEISFFLSFFFSYVKPNNSSMRYLDSHAQDATRELISIWLRGANKISSGWGAMGI